MWRGKEGITVLYCVDQDLSSFKNLKRYQGRKVVRYI